MSDNHDSNREGLIVIIIVIIAIGYTTVSTCIAIAIL